MTEAALETQILKAHADADLCALISLYVRAADLAECNSATDRACFFLTHAWIFALEAGDARAAELKARLVQHGRDIA